LGLSLGLAAAAAAAGLTLVAASSGPAGAAVVASAANPAGGASPAGGLSIPSPVCLPRRTPINHGPASLVGQSTLANTGGRVLSLTLNAPAMGDQQHVYVLLPRGYDPSGATRYPVLYLLHGAGGTYRDWVNMGVENDIDYTSVADHLGPFITVMPDDGAWGFYTDWYGNDVDGLSSSAPPAWATYDIDELIPWVDGHFSTVATRAGRAIAGLSMGGFGAMSYAARYPDLFAAAGSFSGVTDTDIDYPAGGEILNLLSSTFTHGPPNQCIWGDTVTQGVRWHAGDPTYLATNLAPVSLFVASGNGHPGIYDKKGKASTYKASTYEDGLVESVIDSMNQGFTAALTAAGITYTGYFYGNGTHSWGYWLRDLAHFLPQMSAVFARPQPLSTTAPFSYQTVDTSFSTRGYQFSIAHLAEGFTYLTNVSPTGMSVVGTGTLAVETSANYGPGQPYRVTVNGSSTTVEADASGRLSFTVGLGAPSPVQQFEFSSSDLGSFPHAQVSIAAG
jgi:S-formylglutathione hydrolase FrmB